MKDRNLNHSDDWGTPDDLYSKLKNEFKFDFDPCPLHAEFDGLSVEWGERNFINPPYSRKLKELFIRKAFEESQKGKLCVMLCLYLHLQRYFMISFMEMLRSDS